MQEKLLNSKTLGSRLRKERLRLGMTQEAVANATGVRRVTVYQYEKGDRFPSLDFVLNASLLGFSLQFLFFGEHRLITAKERFVDAELASDLYKLVDRVAVDKKGRSLRVDIRAALFDELVAIAINTPAAEVDKARFDRVLRRFVA